MVLGGRHPRLGLRPSLSHDMWGFQETAAAPSDPDPDWYDGGVVDRLLTERAPAILVVFVVVSLVVLVPLFLEAGDLISLPQRVENLLFYAFFALLIAAIIGIPVVVLLVL